MKRTTAINLEHEMAAVAAAMRARATFGALHGFDSPAERIYMASCRLVHDATRTTLIFTRDTGHHTSGWFKSPDYERCTHLSVSPAPESPSGLIVPRRLRRPQVGELDRAMHERWVRAFYPDDIDKLWAESPKTEAGKRVGVWHWRCFCDELWQPIIPRGEVYSTELTEKGWMTGSEVKERYGITVESPLTPG